MKFLNKKLQGLKRIYHNSPLHQDAQKNYENWSIKKLTLGIIIYFFSCSLLLFTILLRNSWGIFFFTNFRKSILEKIILFVNSTGNKVTVDNVKEYLSILFFIFIYCMFAHILLSFFILFLKEDFTSLTVKSKKVIFKALPYILFLFVLFLYGMPTPKLVKRLDNFCGSNAAIVFSLIDFIFQSLLILFMKKIIFDHNKNEIKSYKGETLTLCIVLGSCILFLVDYRNIIIRSLSIALIVICIIYSDFDGRILNLFIIDFFILNGYEAKSVGMPPLCFIFSLYIAEFIVYKYFNLNTANKNEIKNIIKNILFSNGTLSGIIFVLLLLKILASGV